MKGLAMSVTLLTMACMIILIALIFLLPDMVMGQGLPGLPSEPEQTPIDGGLGILAAIGGAYAIKKLSDKE